MNSKFFPSSLVVAIGLLLAPQTSEAAITCIFDVDESSGIGSGSFTIDLPEFWPPPPLNFGQVRTTVIPASSVRGFFARGDKWNALSISLNTFLEQPNNAVLSGSCKKAGAFRTPPSIEGLSPVEAVANLPGVTLRSSVVAPSDVSRQRRNRLLEQNILLKARVDRVAKSRA
jgi:hypothetical protein